MDVRTACQAFEDVRHLRVNAAHLATSNAGGLDFERCSALHNAVYAHAWVASGHAPSDLPRTTWWQANVASVDIIEPRLDVSVVEFLKSAWVVQPYPNSIQRWDLTYQCYDLMWPEGLFEYWEDGQVDLVTLYATHPEGTKDEFVDGIVYNQDTHTAVFNPYTPMDLTPDLTQKPWRSLEAILSVWIDMIEQGKTVALHHSVEIPPPVFDVPQPDGSILHVPAYVPAGPLRDPVTNVQKLGTIFEPWVMVPYTELDLEQTLKAWSDLLQAIEDHLPPGERHDSISHGLFDAGMLQQANIRQDSFAWKFFLRARKPRTRYQGPALQLPSAQQLTSDMLSDPTGDAAPVKPIPILIGRTNVHTPWIRWQVPLEPDPLIPWGLYLDACDPGGLTPFEDGIRLVLPYQIGGNGHVRMSDGSTSNSRQDLYQIGWNPFGYLHPIQLEAVFTVFRQYVQSGVWTVGSMGISESEDAFKTADTDISAFPTLDESPHPGFRINIGPGSLF
ncbi:hypothetical protein LTR86_001313 [Recurvomyces mirabilis]|nr:hypothetical protein LTR86_001313 [Recurvomyces mirabilis]